MRDYKFRGKRIDNGEWVIGSYTHCQDGEGHTTIIPFRANYHVPVDPKTVGQYTGLQDRNGKDIYEGDIIKINLDQSYVDKPFYICEVTYRADEGYPAFDLEPWIDCGMNALAWLKSESDPSVVSYEVIGNRWDNPDLLGG